jgi:O-antigen/teichoic acid export membrane protein
VSSVARRLLLGFGANSFGRVMTTLVQIVSVPMFLQHWGTALYGDWILLNAIPGYFALSDVGFGSVAGNEMTMLMGQNKSAEALEVFQSVWVLTTSISGALGLLLVSTIWFLPLDRWVHLARFTTSDVRIIVLLLTLSVLIGMQETLLQSAFRSVGKYAYGTMAKNLVTLASFSGIMIAVVLGAGPRWAALVYFLVNGVGTLVLWILLRRTISWIRIGTQHATSAAIRKLTSPAISYMSFPVANAVVLQGILLIIGAQMGSVAVVVFSTARTISRSTIQVMQLINASVWPEMSVALGRGDLNLARRLHRHSCQASIALCLGISLVVVLFGNAAWRTWTVGKISTDPVLLYIMLVQLLVSSLWFTSSVVQVSINKHQGLAKVNLLSAVASVLFASVLMKVTSLGLRGAAAALLLGDAILTTYVMRTSLALVHDTLPQFVRSMLQLPKLGRIILNALWRA